MMPRNISLINRQVLRKEERKGGRNIGAGNLKRKGKMFILVEGLVERFRSIPDFWASQKFARPLVRKRTESCVAKELDRGHYN